MNLLQRTIKIMIVLIFLVTSVLIGIPGKNNLEIVNILIAVTAILSIINNRKSLRLEIKITDIFLILIVIASILPLILKTYVSLNNTVNYILRYMSILLLYFIIKKESENSSKIFKYITNTLIIIAMFMIVFGIDLMTTKFIKPILQEITGESKIFTYEIRMTSLFTYANAFAIFMSITSFLILGRIQQAKTTKITTIYLVTLMWTFIGIVSSESRLTYGALGIAMLIYLILNKNNCYDIIKNLIVNGILAVVITTVYFNLINLGMYIQIWIGVIIVTLLSIIINYYQQKLPRIKLKLNWKTILIIIGIMLLLAIILLNMESDLLLFKGNDAQTTVRKTLCKIDYTKEYTFRIELESKSNIEENFTISIIEQNKLYTDTKKTSITLDNFSGIKEIRITPQKDTVYSRIYFKAKETNANTELKIKSIYINDKKIIINYKFLPSEIIAKLRTSGIITRNLTERLDFLKSALVGMISNRGLGIGGGGWKYAHFKYQDYKSSITEVHSYIGQLSVELGAIGIFAYLGLIVSLIVYAIKNIKKNEKNEIPVMCAILVVVLHSCLDFEMSYFFIMLVTYSLIAILTAKLKENVKIKVNNKIIIVITVLIIIPLTIINLNAIYSKKYLEPEMLKTTKTYSEKISMQSQNVKLNPYNSKYRVTYIKTWQIYSNSIKDITEEDKISFIITTTNQIEKLYANESLYMNVEISSILENNVIELLEIGEADNLPRYLNLLYNIYDENIGVIYKYEPVSLLEQVNNMYQFIEKLKQVNSVEWVEKFETLYKEKIELVKEQINDYGKCQITQKESEMYLEMCER